MTTRRRRRLRRAWARHRRAIAAVLAAATVCTAVAAARAPAAPTVDVWVAVSDLPGGARLERGHIRSVPWPAGAVPAGATTDGTALAGRTLAAPVRRGEAVTDVRLVGPAMVQGYGDGLVAAPVRLADPGTVALLRPGDVVDVLAAEAPGDHATTPTRTAARTVAAAVRVALVPGAGDSGTGGALGAGSESSAEGALVVLAVSRDTAAALAQAAATSRLTVAIRAG